MVCGQPAASTRACTLASILAHTLAHPGAHALTHTGVYFLAKTPRKALARPPVTAPAALGPRDRRRKEGVLRHGAQGQSVRIEHAMALPGNHSGCRRGDLDLRGAKS